jgi:hypothetical protein
VPTATRRDQVLALAVVGHGVLASASRDRTVRLWHVGTGRELCRMEGHDDAVTALAELPCAAGTASQGGHAICTVRFSLAVLHTEHTPRRESDAAGPSARERGGQRGQRGGGGGGGRERLHGPGRATLRVGESVVE